MHVHWLRHLFFLLILQFLFVATVAAAEYQLSHVCRTEARLKITKVTITADETLIDLEWNETQNNYPIGIYPPGHDMAFYIADAQTGKKYNLLDSSGIAIRPNVNRLNSGNKINFQLVFEKIAMKRFHLIEGKLPTETMVTWHFTNIKL